jgi:hypothetical protein
MGFPLGLAICRFQDFFGVKERFAHQPRMTSRQSLAFDCGGCQSSDKVDYLAARGIDFIGRKKAPDHAGAFCSPNEGEKLSTLQPPGHPS